MAGGTPGLGPPGRGAGLGWLMSVAVPTNSPTGYRPRGPARNTVAPAAEAESTFALLGQAS